MPQLLEFSVSITWGSVPWAARDHFSQSLPEQGLGHDQELQGADIPRLKLNSRNIKAGPGLLCTYLNPQCPGLSFIKRNSLT